jgi:hypothetical protein
MKLLIYLLPVPRLRMDEAVPLVPLYVFMAWTGTTLTVIVIIRSVHLKVELKELVSSVETMAHVGRVKRSSHRFFIIRTLFVFVQNFYVFQPLRVLIGPLFISK